jgi:predicted nuclease of predicted toxin-antitoxin system
VLVKELQGLGLKVDLVQSDAVIDAEDVLATNVHEEATHPAEVEVPADAISDIDVTEEAVADEFAIVGLDDDMADDATTDDTPDAALVTADEDTNTEEEA